MKYSATAISTVVSSLISGSSISPTASGARFGTVAVNVCFAQRPPGSVAVTVTVAVPALTPVTWTAASEMDTCTPECDETAV